MKILVRSMPKSKEIKKQIRKEYKQKRNSLTAEQVRAWSDCICNRLTESDLFHQANEIFFYYPLGNEANLLKAAQIALELGKAIAFPRTEGDVMHFYQVTDLNEFKVGSFQVMEPVSDRVLITKKPLILTPGLVFDKKKNRMGYGKGYYDRFIAEYPNAVTIGIAYEMQLAKKIVAEVHDIPMNYILTEKRMW